MTPNEFVVIVDRDGDVVEFCSPNDDIVWALCRESDRNYPQDSPHIALFWDGEKWRKYL